LSSGAYPLVAGLVGREVIEVQDGGPGDFLGGAALYAAIAASASGPVSLAASVGGDLAGELHRVCRDLRIGTESIEVLGPHSFSITGRYESLEGRLEVTRVRWGAVLLRDVGASSAGLGSRPGLLLANDDPQAHLGLIGSGRIRFLGLCLNAEWLETSWDAYADLMNQAHVVFMNRLEWDLLGRVERRRLESSLTVVTDGSAAIRYSWPGSEMQSFEPRLCRPLEAADPTGCGDAFAGALFARLLAQTRQTQETWRQDLAHAALVAGLKLERRGAADFAAIVQSLRPWDDGRPDLRDRDRS
jgi:hypothetical protein